MDVDEGRRGTGRTNVVYGTNEVTMGEGSREFAILGLAAEPAHSQSADLGLELRPLPKSQTL